MSKKNYNNIFTKVFNLINDTVNMSSKKRNNVIDIELIMTGGARKEIKITNNNVDLIKINRNIIIIDKEVSRLEDIVKLKILDTNMDDKTKNLFIAEIENIIEKEIILENKNAGYYRGINSLSSEKNIEWYINENKNNINTICCKGTNFDSYINNISSVDKSGALSYDTSLDIKRKAILEDLEVNVEKNSVLSSIEYNKEKVVKEIETEEIFVLTNNSDEVEVAKPIKVEGVEVVKDIHMENCKVITNQSSTKVVKDIKEKKSEAIKDIKIIYEEKIIGNVNTDIQLIKPKIVDVLIVEPSNKNINKEEIKDKYLTLDPTGENYIGIVLDDGTFEPLKVSMETITVVPNDIENILVNIDENKNIVNQVVKDINYSKDYFTNSVDIQYDNNILEKRDENETYINNIIKASNSTINNIVNNDETVFVTTKENLESIKNIKGVQYDSVSKINKIEKIDMVESVKPIENKNYVVEDIKLDKKTTNLISNVEISKENILTPFKENINGVIKQVGSGVMLVDNYDSGITIYSTSKISSVL